MSLWELTVNVKTREADKENQHKLAWKVSVVFIAATSSIFCKQLEDCCKQKLQAALKTLNDCKVQEKANQEVEMAIEMRRIIKFKPLTWSTKLSKKGCTPSSQNSNPSKPNWQKPPWADAVPNRPCPLQVAQRKVIKTFWGHILQLCQAATSSTGAQAWVKEEKPTHCQSKRFQQQRQMHKSRQIQQCWQKALQVNALTATAKREREAMEPVEEEIQAHKQRRLVIDGFLEDPKNQHGKTCQTSFKCFRQTESSIYNATISPDLVPPWYKPPPLTWTQLLC